MTNKAENRRVEKRGRYTVQCTLWSIRPVYIAAILANQRRLPHTCRTFHRPCLQCMEGQYILSQVFLLLARCPHGVTERNSPKLCHMFGNETDLKMVVQNFGNLPRKSYGPKLPIFGGGGVRQYRNFSTLRKETRHRKWKKRL